MTTACCPLQEKKKSYWLLTFEKNNFWGELWVKTYIRSTDIDLPRSQSIEMNPVDIHICEFFSGHQGTQSGQCRPLKKDFFIQSCFVATQARCLSLALKKKSFQRSFGVVFHIAFGNCNKRGFLKRVLAVLSHSSNHWLTDASKHSKEN